MRDAYGHLKAIGVDDGGQQLLKLIGIAPDAGVANLRDAKSFLNAAKTRQWAREATLRSLA